MNIDLSTIKPVRKTKKKLLESKDPLVIKLIDEVTGRNNPNVPDDYRVSDELLQRVFDLEFSPLLTAMNHKGATVTYMFEGKENYVTFKQGLLVINRLSDDSESTQVYEVTGLSTLADAKFKIKDVIWFLLKNTDTIFIPCGFIVLVIYYRNLINSEIATLMKTALKSFSKETMDQVNAEFGKYHPGIC